MLETALLARRRSIPESFQIEGFSAGCCAARLGWDADDCCALVVGPEAGVAEAGASSKKL